MVDGIIEIAEDGRHLSLYRGFLVVSQGNTELGRVPLADVSALVISANQASISKPILTALAAQNSVVICCGATYLPSSISLPYCGNYESAHRMRKQIAAALPLCKKIWKRLVQEKIANQAAVLQWRGQSAPGKALEIMRGKVRSGDPDNFEAQAARQYWPRVFRPGFVRDRTAQNENILFNYCYTVLRSAVARAIMASGLLPALGVHHRSRMNPYALVDDLMEPYRPLADSLVVCTVEENQGNIDLTPAVKRSLARILRLDLHTQKGISPLAEVLQCLALSLAQCYEDKKEVLKFGKILLPENTEAATPCTQH